jgi:predicted metal-binding protein
MNEALLNQIKEIGVFQYGFLRPDDIEYRQDIRNICQNDCKNYGKSWACPPGVGSVEECKDRCLQFDTMFVFSGKYAVVNFYDNEGFMFGMKDFKRVSRGIDRIVKDSLKNYLVLSNEGCDICELCTYPDKPCRFPEKAQHSIEGYGIVVSRLAEKAKVNYNNEENTVTYFGALLYNAER